MLWSRKSTPVHERSRVVGLDLTASRARAASVGGGKYRTPLLDEPAEDLLLFVAGDRRSPEVGRAGYGLSRKLPHVVCSNFLPALGQPREWKTGRHTLTPESALEITLAKLVRPITAESEAVALALPYYLAPAQVAKVVVTAARARLPLKGTATAPLALAADRAAAVLAGKPAAPAAPAEGVVPMHPAGGGPCSVVVVDVDEFALSAAVVSLERDTARMMTSAAWPRASLKVWKDKLLDAVSDRCVRLCRRDPRDSADAEQALFEQLDDALDRLRAGHRVNLTVRTTHWFQDVPQQPDEFDGYCAALARSSVEGVRELFYGAGLPVPPRAVWLTHAAGRLPGLAKAMHQHTPEGTAVETLPASAVPLAAAALVPGWLTGDLPRQHLDTVLPFAPVSRESKASATATPRSSSTRG
jgi:hypothetical protein